MTRIRWTICLAAGVLFAASGCGGDPTASIPLVPVRGTVTINGKPLGNARVSFVPVDTGSKISTSGGDTTGPEGNYMATFSGRSGLAVGKYKVTVTPNPPDEEAAKVSDAFKDDPFMAAEASRAAVASKPSKAKPPEVKGEFDADVDGSKKTYDFDVKAKAADAAFYTKGNS